MVKLWNVLTTDNLLLAKYFFLRSFSFSIKTNIGDQNIHSNEITTYQKWVEIDASLINEHARLAFLKK